MATAASNGSTTMEPNATEYPDGGPIPVITAAITGGVAAAARFCAVFCTPSARPAQAWPARSATAVKASPLVLTVSTAASMIAGTATAEPLTIPAASTSSTT